MTPIQRRYLQRRWPLLLLVMACAALLGVSIFQDCYYRGHRPVFGMWGWWTFGIRDGNLFSHISRGEGDFFGELDQIIRLNHAPALGSMPALQWSPYRAEASCPAWLPLAGLLGWMVFLQLKWRRKVAED